MMQHSRGAVVRLISHDPGLFSSVHRHLQIAAFQSKGKVHTVATGNKQQAIRDAF
jgi:hypothetical protein